MEVAEHGTCRALGRAILLKIGTGFAPRKIKSVVHSLLIGCTSFSAFSCAYAIKVRPGESFGRNIGLD